MRMWDDSTIKGQLVEPALTFATAAGPVVRAVPANITAIARSYALPDPDALVEIEKLIAQLGTESYIDREAATKELVKMGKGIVPLLKRHRNDSDLEIRTRVERILNQINPEKVEPVPPPMAEGRNGVHHWFPQPT